MKNAFLYLLFFTSKHIMDTCVCVHNNFVPLHVQNFYSPPTVNFFIKKHSENCLTNCTFLRKIQFFILFSTLPLLCKHDFANCTIVF